MYRRIKVNFRKVQCLFGFLHVSTTLNQQHNLYSCVTKQLRTRYSKVQKDAVFQFLKFIKAL